MTRIVAPLVIVGLIAVAWRVAYALRAGLETCDPYGDWQRTRDQRRAKPVNAAAARKASDGRPVAGGGVARA